MPQKKFLIYYPIENTSAFGLFLCISWPIVNSTGFLPFPSPVGVTILISTSFLAVISISLMPIIWIASGAVSALTEFSFVFKLPAVNVFSTWTILWIPYFATDFSTADLTDLTADFTYTKAFFFSIGFSFGLLIISATAAT